VTSAAQNVAQHIVRLHRFYHGKITSAQMASFMTKNDHNIWFQEKSSPKIGEFGQKE
jgi:hypothetical protein